MPHFMQAHEPCTVYYVLLDCNSTKWTGNALSIPAAACSQQLLRRNKLPTGCYFFACVVFSPHNMNVFVTDFIVDNDVTHMQGFSSGILIIFFEKVCVKCEGICRYILLPYTVPCMVNMQHSVWESWLMCGSHTWFRCTILLDVPLSVICICIKCPNSLKKISSQEFPLQSVSYERPHSLQLHVNCTCYTDRG